MSLSLVSSVALGSAKVRDDLKTFSLKAFDDPFRCVLGDDVSGPQPNTVAVHIDAEAVSRFGTDANYHRTHPLGCLKQTLLEPSRCPSVSWSKEMVEHFHIIAHR